jgi:hypothetical protein
MGVLAAVALAGCIHRDGRGGGTPRVNITGYWEGTAKGGSTFAFNIDEEADGAVAGEGGMTNGNGNLTGVVSGRRFTYTINWDAGGITIGAATIEGDRMHAVATPDAHSVEARQLSTRMR